MSSQRWRGCSLALLIVGVPVTVFLALAVSASLNTPLLGGLAQVGEDAEAHPFVRQVRYEDDFFFVDEIEIILTAGADETEANVVWCDVLLPRNVDVNRVGVTNLVGYFAPPDECLEVDDAAQAATE